MMMEQLEQAKNLALKYVSVRLRTGQEVQQMLQKKGYSAEIVQEVLTFLQRYQYLDDAAYCRSWIHDKVQFHPCGRQKMAFELAKKIKNRQLIAQSLEAYFPTEIELDLAMAAARKKLSSGRTCLTREQLSRFLHSRGYGGSIIQKVLQTEEILEELDQKQCDNNF